MFTDNMAFPEIECNFCDTDFNTFDYDICGLSSDVMLHSTDSAITLTDCDKLLSSTTQDTHIFDIQSNDDNILDTELRRFDWSSEEEELYTSIDQLNNNNMFCFEDASRHSVMAASNNNNNNKKRCLNELIDLREFDLRDQLDLLCIVSPHSCLPTTELVIDMSSLSATQLNDIDELLRRTRKPDVQPSSGCSQVSQQQTKRAKKERCRQLKSIRQQEKKENRQVQKERRSGLFVKEQVVSLSGYDEMGEVDILS